MKSLTDQLYESMNVYESKEEKYFRFTFGSLDKADETIKSIEDVASKNGIYSEKVDKGIKIKLNDSNYDKADSIQDIVQQYVQKMQDDDKANQDDVKKLADVLDDMTEYLDADDDDKNDEKDDNSKEGE